MPGKGDLRPSDVDIERVGGHLGRGRVNSNGTSPNFEGKKKATPEGVAFMLPHAQPSPSLGSNNPYTKSLDHQGSFGRRPSLGNESCVSGFTDLTGVTAASASDITPEGRAVRAYLKQPLQLRANIEAWEIHLEDITDRQAAFKQGQGVEKARWRNMDVIVKSVKGGTAGDSQMLQHEIQVLTRNRHPNLVMFLGACTTVEPIQVVVEFMPQGSIDNYYEEQRQQRGSKAWQPPDTQLMAWTIDLFRALCFLHMSRPPIIHMNLVPSNLLLSSNLTLKLSGFGLSRSRKRVRGAGSDINHAGVDLRYVAPEVLMDRNVTEKVDVYSAGMVMYFLVTGEAPFKDNPGIVHKLVEEAKAPKGLSVSRPPREGVKWQAYAEIMEECWFHTYEDRPTSSAVMESLERLTVQNLNRNTCVPPGCVVS